MRFYAFFLLFPSLISADTLTSCKGSELSLNGNSTTKSMRTDCQVVVGNLVFENLNGIVNGHYLLKVVKIEGSIVFRNNVNVAGIDLNTVREIVSNGTAAIIVEKNKDSELAFGDAIQSVKTSNTAFTYVLRDNIGMTLRAELYSRLFFAATPTGRFNMNIPLENGFCDETFYKISSAVYGSLLLAVFVALLTVSFYGR